MTKQEHRQEPFDPRRELLPRLPLPTPGSGALCDAELLAQLLGELSKVWETLLSLEQEFQHHLDDTHVEYRRSARNLVHYMALRRHDIRRLQEQLAALGLSSLGRTESHVAAGIEAVLKILHLLSQHVWQPPSGHVPGVAFTEGTSLLRRHTEAVLGPQPAKRGVRIMVTMPSEAAHDYRLVRALLADGMDCMRINCAHDDRVTWAGMVANLQAAKQELGRECRILMDLAGPKLRTGPIDPRSQVVKWRPRRDALGRVTSPARVWLTPAEGPEEPPEPSDGCLCIPASLLTGAHRGDRVKLTDLRGKSRTLTLGKAHGCSRWATSSQTAYLAAGARVPVTYVTSVSENADIRIHAEVGAPPPAQRFIVLKPGDSLVLAPTAVPGTAAAYDAHGHLRTPAIISCTLPEVLADVRPNERIWFDDGKIGGVVESVEPDGVRVRITSARDSGEKLRADKGINLPDTKFRLPALTVQDADDLQFVVRHADLVGLSFVRRPEDVLTIQKELARLDAQHLGIVLKIETRTAFEQLPKLLLAAMRGERVGVMIARGDLGVECGFERLAEVQEEILWVCEAAHIPVIWATQVLENLAKKGMPSRAEITDAAMGERAECVMLNKGPHLLETVRALDDILHRMEAHQSKKSARLRPLRLSTISAT
jgi:pyruvate kinase